MMIEFQGLSPQGQERSRQILDLAIREARRIRRRRHIRNGKLAVICAAMIITALVFVVRPVRQPANVASSTPPLADSQPMANEYRENPMEIPKPASNVKILNDKEFLDAMAEAGKPCGLICINSRVFVVPHYSDTQEQ